MASSFLDNVGVIRHLDAEPEEPERPDLLIPL